LDRKPKALSGGQRQRVAIGRAIVRGPEVFLFDEPLSNLDAELRVEMRVELARLHQEIGATMIYVTHDQVEAMTLADKIVVLRAGNVEQVGSPMQLYKDPDNKFVAGFIGSPGMNFLDGTTGDSAITCPSFGDAQIKTAVSFPKSGETVAVGVRPQHLTIDTNGKGLKVDLIEHLGGVTYIYLNAKNGERLIVEASAETEPPALGSEVSVTFDPKNMMLFDATTEQRLR